MMEGVREFINKMGLAIPDVAKDGKATVTLTPEDMTGFLGILVMLTYPRDDSIHMTGIENIPENWKE